MEINYEHDSNLHTINGAESTLKLIFETGQYRSLLDVGCGTGTWLQAAQLIGISDVVGVDGKLVDRGKLHVASHLVLQKDLRCQWELGRKFDVALCLEVAEHIGDMHAPNLIKTLTAHSDRVFFSAACPGQPGQNHINCQWPDYWQALFNNEGYVCDEWPRRLIWSVQSIEPWYRQNLFYATRSQNAAGKEERIQSIIHPEMFPWMSLGQSQAHQEKWLVQVENGSQPVSWYFKTLLAAWTMKMKRAGKRSEKGIQVNN